MLLPILPVGSKWKNYLWGGKTGKPNSNIFYHMENQIKIKVEWADEIIKSPFLNCPSCNGKELGILDVFNGNLIRKCKACGFVSDAPLPKVKKRILYLDQFVVSNFLKARKLCENGQVIPDSLKRAWTLYRKVKALVQYQLLVCPTSMAHDEESAQAEWSSEDLFALQRELSGDCNILSPYEIVNLQMRHFSEGLFTSRQIDFVRDIDIFMNDPHQWTMRNRVYVDLDWSRWKDTLIAEKVNLKKALDPIYMRWREGKEKSFQEWYAEEIGTHQRFIQGAIQSIFDGGKISDAIPEGTFAYDLATSFFDGIENCDSRKLEKVRGVKFDKLPYLKIHAGIYAELAIRINKQSKKFPPASLANDMEIVAAYLPYVDRILVDNDMHSILRSANLKSILDGLEEKIVSGQNIDDLFEWLNQVEAAIPENQKKMAEDVYF